MQSAGANCPYPFSMAFRNSKISKIKLAKTQSMRKVSLDLYPSHISLLLSHSSNVRMHLLMVCFGRNEKITWNNICWSFFHSSRSLRLLFGEHHSSATTSLSLVFIMCSSVLPGGGRKLEMKIKIWIHWCIVIASFVMPCKWQQDGLTPFSRRVCIINE